ncbi:MAG: family 20 glycosylhydrolase [Kiritimatiellae bacterium]|nr:family 20 glycosylhydrolase [Kiritimatiellia bacterium]
MAKRAQPWSFRGAQLDLARQMETMEYILGYTDFIADHGFNTLVLYLEGRVRTPSFPYPKEDESYSRDEMKDVVRHAAARDIAVVPVVSNLGHAEHFLRHPELAHLAELRDGREGRVSGHQLLDFCPSLKETYQFFESYFTELAELFPSPYFHVGNDEAFDIGCCDLCRARAEGQEGQTGIFAKHLRDTHAIVTGKLGKRMIVWDDLLEHYWGALDQIPRDIVLCCWQYDADVRLPVAHFRNRLRWDLLAEYRKRGFECLVAPREQIWRNTATLTRYAAGQAPMGGLMTTWEHSADFLYACYPNIAFAGRLWSEPERVESPEALQAEVNASYMPEVSQGVVEAVWDALGIGRFAVGSTIPAFLREPGAGRVAERLLLNRLLTAALGTSDAHLTIEDLRIVLGLERLQLELSDLVPRVYDAAARGRTPARLAEALRRCARNAESLLEARRRQWQKCRSALPSQGNALESGLGGLYRSIEEFADKAAKGGLDGIGLLTVEYFLPDLFSCEWIRIVARSVAGDGAWREIAAPSVPKPIFCAGDDEYRHSGYMRVSYPVEAGLTVAECRIESWGYGGIGIRHVEFREPAGLRAPCAVTAADGMVAQPQHILDNSSSWCWLGEPDTSLAFHNPGLARARHSVTLNLSRAT